jgi:hypothetical protein
MEDAWGQGALTKEGFTEEVTFELSLPEEWQFAGGQQRTQQNQEQAHSSKSKQWGELEVGSWS